MKFKDIRVNLLEKNYSEIPFSLSKDELKKAAESFLEFLTLSQKIKDALSVDWNVGEHFSEIGYSKRRSDTGKDDKEFFHFNEVIDIEFKKKFSRRDPRVRKFLSHARIIYKEARKTLFNILLIFEKEFPGITGSFFQENKIPFLYLRFLKYDNKEDGEFLARAHYDRGTLTLALAESAPGLRIGHDEKTLSEVKHKNKTALFMPAIHFHEVTNKNFLPAWHDVVQKGENKVNKEVSRWAIVFFADALSSKTPTWKETHTEKGSKLV
jgi:isopenicillin N synthase-like dioxygenase